MTYQICERCGLARPNCGPWREDGKRFALICGPCKDRATFTPERMARMGALVEALAVEVTRQEKAEAIDAVGEEVPMSDRSLPYGYPLPCHSHIRSNFEQREFVALGYSDAEAWTLYYSQRARVVADPLSPHGGIIQAKASSNLPLTPREKNWIDERIALRTDPAIRLLMDTAEHAGTPIEQTQAEVVKGELGRAVLLSAGRLP